MATRKIRRSRRKRTRRARRVKHRGGAADGFNDAATVVVSRSNDIDSVNTLQSKPSVDPDSPA
jgi:hypothetical protein